MEVETLLKILLENNEVFIAPEEAVQHFSNNLMIDIGCIYLIDVSI